MSAPSRAHAWLARLWWLLWPAFAALTATLVVQRACGQPYRLLPGATSHPLIAWALALLYLAAHVWLLVVYVLTVERTESLVPDRRRLREVWGRTAMRIWWMAAVFAIEYLPVSLWRLVGRAACT